jgi:hypothetical protein
MWQQQLSKIVKEKEEFEELINSPATDEQIEILKKEVKEKFNNILPLGYINFLKTVNGLEYNGFVFYGIDSTLIDFENNQTVYGYIDNNEVWYENEHQKQYMFFGESDISWYTFDLLNKTFAELDKPSGTLMHTYSNFDDMLEKALADSLL